MVFCDISKAFDRVWHAGLIYKLRASGVSGNLLRWFENYLQNRYQRVVIPGAKSDWNYIRAGVPQGSILGPLLFLLYINDIVKDIGSNIRLFADDTSLYIIVENPEVAADILNTDLAKVAAWAQTWLVTFNALKTESLLIIRKHNQALHPPVYMQDQPVKEVDVHKHLGLYFSKDCSWSKQIEYISEKAWARGNIMRKFKFDLDRKSLDIIYTSFIRPLLEYGSGVWDNCNLQEKQNLEKIQLEAARIVTGATKLVSFQALYNETGWETLEVRRKKQKLTLFYKMCNGLSPAYLSSLVPPTVNSISRYHLRNENDLQTVNARTTLYYQSFLPSVVRDWNSLPDDHRNATTIGSFKCQLNHNKKVVPRHFYIGHRKLQVLHTRLRTKCSVLNYDLFIKHIVASQLCRCGEVENAEYYFLKCSFYRNQRAKLIRTVSQFCRVTINCLLRGNSDLSYQRNVRIFEAVQAYIQDSKRF